MSWQSAGKLLPPEVHATLEEGMLGPGRLIIIGDVHGCVRELRDLLDEADYVEGNDTVVLVGDLVDKGPYPLEVRRPACPLLALLAPERSGNSGENTLVERGLVAVQGMQLLSALQSLQN